MKSRPHVCIHTTKVRSSPLKSCISFSCCIFLTFAKSVFEYERQYEHSRLFQQDNVQYDKKMKLDDE